MLTKLCRTDLMTIDSLFSRSLPGLVNDTRSVAPSGGIHPNLAVSCKAKNLASGPEGAVVLLRTAILPSLGASGVVGGPDRP